MRAKFYLNAGILRRLGACPMAIKDMENIFGAGKNWPVNDASYKKLKKANAQWRIVWVAKRYLNEKEMSRVRRRITGDYEDQWWAAIKKKMQADNKPRPAHHY